MIKRKFDENFQIKNDASPNLKKIRFKKSRLDEKIKLLMKQYFINAKKNNWLNENQINWREGTFVLPLKNKYKRKIKGIIIDHSDSGKTIYLEPIDILDLKNELINLDFKERQEIKRILKILSVKILSHSKNIINSFNEIVKFDIHHTIALLANHLNAIKPEITNKKEINLEDAINPLFFLTNKKGVPLNIKIDKEKVILISGPNAGGKTVVLKSVGLFSLMMQTGLFIPAKKAQLPTFDIILTDIGDQQSITNDLSTFSAHIQNIVKIINNATNRSLILLDELGTGTDPEAGSAISQSILEKFIKKEALVVATTHLNALKIWASSNSKVINGGMAFNSKNLKPTFKFNLGMPKPSYALEISDHIGLNKSIINRAKKIINSDSIKLDKILADLEKRQQKLKDHEKYIHKQRAKIIAKEKSISLMEKKILEHYQKLEFIAAQKAESIINDARKLVENIVLELRHNQANTKNIKEARIKLKDDVEKHRLTILKHKNKLLNKINIKDLNVGRRVFLKKLNAKGQIMSIPNKKGDVAINIDGKKIIAKIEDLSLNIDIVNEKKNDFQNKYFNYNKSLESIRLDVRGKKVDEAILLVENFLDRAIISNMDFVEILHGKGTGTLMSSIQDYLKDQEYIKKFYFSDEDSGGVGITIVEFK
tara:strand:+ start:1736 stop:3694 length:1959 start_codon:yes stop_codon:yes gene_type:complete